MDCMSVIIVWQDLICSFTLLQLEALLMPGQSAEGLKKCIFLFVFSTWCIACSIEIDSLAWQHIILFFLICYNWVLLTQYVVKYENMQECQIKYLNYWDNAGVVSRTEFKSVAYYLFIIDISLSHLFCDNRELQYMSFSIFMYKENF